MPTSDILKVVTGVSSFLGLAGLIAYLYFTLQFRRAEYSIRGLLEGETLFNAEQVLKILSQFQDDKSRLDALKALTNYDVSRAGALLKKVRGNVDVARLTQISSKHYRQLAIVSAIFFLILAVVAYVYSMHSFAEKPANPQVSGGPFKPLYGPTPIDPNATYRISVAWVDLKHCNAVICDVRVRLRAWQTGTGVVLADSSAVVPSWSEGTDPLTDKERKMGIKPVSLRHPDLERGEITFLGKDTVSLQMGCDDSQGNPVFGSARELDAHDLHTIFPMTADCGWVSLEMGLAVGRSEKTTPPKFADENGKPK